MYNLYILLLSEKKRSVLLMRYEGEYRQDVDVMRAMGLPLSFFNSPFDKADQVWLLPMAIYWYSKICDCGKSYTLIIS